MVFKLLFFIAVMSIIIVTVDLCMEVIKERKLVAEGYKENLEKRNSFRYFWDTLFHSSDPICKGGIEHKRYICRQILESMKMKLGKDETWENNGWPCEGNYVNISNTLIHENLLRCPGKKKANNESLLPYFISFGRYNFFRKYKIRVFGFIKELPDDDNIAFLDKYFKNVDIIELPPDEFNPN